MRTRPHPNWDMHLYDDNGPIEQIYPPFAYDDEDPPLPRQGEFVELPDIDRRGLVTRVVHTLYGGGHNAAACVYVRLDRRPIREAEVRD